MTESVAILGSTGSVGMQALDVAKHLGIRVDGLAAHGTIKLLEQQIRAFHPKYCAVIDKDAARRLSEAVADTDVKVFGGEDAVCEMIAVTDADTVLNAISGIAGLRPTMAVIEAGKTLALANKESLVAFGSTVMSEAKKKGVSIIPVDSEHSAIFQCLAGSDRENVCRLILTASGGPFFGMSKEQLGNITPRDALTHPTWNMGRRITIDSATMMNKGLEVIEAVHLFGVSADKIDVVVHRESIIHSMVEYNDSAVIAQLAVPDMRLCVQYALTYPNRYKSPVDRLNLASLRSLSFFEPDKQAFPLLPLAYEVIEKGGLVPAAMNAADEAAVELFLIGKIGFNDISAAVAEATENCVNILNPTLEEVEAADRAARECVYSLVR